MEELLRDRIDLLRGLGGDVESELSLSESVKMGGIGVIMSFLVVLCVSFAFLVLLVSLSFLVLLLWLDVLGRGD